MSTSVKMYESTKDRLERLQAKVKLETGEKVTQAELLERVVDAALDAEEEVLDSFRDSFEGLSEEEIEQWLSGTTASGDPLGEDDVDDVLYGDR